MLVGNGVPNRYYGGMDERNPRFPNKLAVMGVFLVLAGGVLLLRTTGYLPRFAALWPLAPLLLGLILLYYRVFRTGPDYYVFLGTALLLTGFMLLLTGTVVLVELRSIWPVFMTVIGVALLLYGLRKHGSSRVTFTIPGGAMVLLSGLFLPFSLEVVTTGFSVFVAAWWPILIVVMGAALVIAHISRQRRR